MKVFERGEGIDLGNGFFVTLTRGILARDLVKRKPEAIIMIRWGWYKSSVVITTMITLRRSECYNFAKMSSLDSVLKVVLISILHLCPSNVDLSVQFPILVLILQWCHPWLVPWTMWNVRLSILWIFFHFIHGLLDKSSGATLAKWLGWYLGKHGYKCWEVRLSNDLILLII